MRPDNLIRNQLAVLITWAVLMFSLILIRPSPKGVLFWVLAIPAFVLGYWSQKLRADEDNDLKNEWAAWDKRMKHLVDAHDVQNLHLYEQFDKDEWKRIFKALERMPQGARSLRKAILTVDPEYDDA